MGKPEHKSTNSPLNPYNHEDSDDYGVNSYDDDDNGHGDDYDGDDNGDDDDDDGVSGLHQVNC